MAGYFTFVEEDIPSTSEWNTLVRDQLVIICTSSTRPGSPVTGERIFETDTLKEYVYNSGWIELNNAGAWSTYTPTWYSSGTQPVLGNGTIVGRYRKLGRLLVNRVVLTMGSTTTYGTGYYYFSYPSLTMQSSSGSGTDHQGKGTAQDGGTWYPLTVVGGVSYIFLYYTASGTLATVTPTAPFTFASGDVIVANVVTETTT